MCSVDLKVCSEFSHDRLRPGWKLTLLPRRAERGCDHQHTILSSHPILEGTNNDDDRSFKKLLGPVSELIIEVFLLNIKYFVHNSVTMVAHKLYKLSFHLKDLKEYLSLNPV